MDVIASDERLRNLYDAGRGFMFNDFEGPRSTQSSSEANKLHRGPRATNAIREGTATR